MEEEMQEVVVTLIIHASVEMKRQKDEKGNTLWSREFYITNYIKHWLYEGDYIEDCSILIPGGIEFVDYNIKFGKKFMKEIKDDDEG